MGSARGWQRRVHGRSAFRGSARVATRDSLPDALKRSAFVVMRDPFGQYLGFAHLPIARMKIWTTWLHMRSSLAVRLRSGPSPIRRLTATDTGELRAKPYCRGWIRQVATTPLFVVLGPRNLGHHLGVDHTQDQPLAHGDEAGDPPRDLSAFAARLRRGAPTALRKPSVV